MIRLACFLALAATASPAAAQPAQWVHKKSGISLPGIVDEMQLGQEMDLSQGKGFDVVVQYGSATDPVTVYVYRASYPNAALWFERVRQAMKSSVRLPTENVAPRSFSFAGAATPNALREEVDIPVGSGPWKATGVALAQVGEWIVKARISSQSLDRAGVAAKMDKLLAAFRREATPAKTLPLIVPAPCGAGPDLAGKPVAERTDEMTAGAMATGLVAFTQARGVTGLAAEPDQWCRESSQIPSQYVSVYRRRDAKAWVALVGDAGMSVSGYSFEAPMPNGAATFGNSASATGVVALFDGLPDPDAAIPEGLPVAAGRSPGLIQISVGQDGEAAK